MKTENQPVSEKECRHTYVGQGLEIQSEEKAAEKDLNGNRNSNGRFNIDLNQLATELIAQGRADASFVKNR